MKINPKDIAFISKNEDGNYYIGLKMKVQRGIKGKTKSKVDELLILGIPKDKFQNWMKENNYEGS